MHVEFNTFLLLSSLFQNVYLSLSKPYFLQISINRIFKPFSKCCEIFYCRLNKRLIFDDRFCNDRLFFLFLIPPSHLCIFFAIFFSLLRREKNEGAQILFLFHYFSLFTKNRLRRAMLLCILIVGYFHFFGRIEMFIPFLGSIKWQWQMFFFFFILTSNRNFTSQDEYLFCGSLSLILFRVYRILRRFTSK